MRNKKIRKIIALFLTLTMCFFTLVGCVPEGNEITLDYVLTQKPLGEGKTVITILVKNAFTINAFEKRVEELFPDIEIVQVGNHSFDMGKLEYEARLKNQDLTDIVMTWPAEIGTEYLKECFLDLSTLSLTGRYTTKSLNSLSQQQDGKLYYLPGPSQVRGIVYNKTLFEENGWSVPSDFEGFISLCKQIERTGIRSLQLGFGNGEVLDTAFMGFSFAECFSKPEDAYSLNDLIDGKESFADNFRYGLETFQRMIDEGIFKTEDLNITYIDRENMLFDRRAAMVEDSVLLARMAAAATGHKDEFALMPFFNEGEMNDWARLYPVCFIGANKNLQDEGNEEKLEIVLKLLDYISTPEGQAALAEDTGAMFSSLKGVSAPDIPEIKDLMTALNAGRYGVFPTFGKLSSAFRSNLAKMLKGEASIEEVIATIDKEGSLQKPESKPIVIGTASEDFGRIETNHFLADALREFFSTEIALVIDNGMDGKNNGMGITGSIYEGEITTDDIQRIMPDFRDKVSKYAVLVKMTGEDLIRTLEYSTEVNGEYSGWMYYSSGLEMEYYPTAPMGERIKKITFGGEKIIPDKIYSIVTTGHALPEENLLYHVETMYKLSDIFGKKIDNIGEISPSKDGRLKIIY